MPGAQHHSPSIRDRDGNHVARFGEALGSCLLSRADWGASKDVRNTPPLPVSGEAFAQCLEVASANFALSLRAA